MIDDDTVAQVIAKDQIRDCLARYCRGVDRKDWDLLRSTYHEDAHDDHGAYKGDVNGLIDWIRRGHERVTQSMHFLGASVIEVDGDAAVADTQCVTFQRRLVPPDTTESARADDVPVQMMAISRYADRFERRGGGWRIAARVCILESMTMTPIASPELVPTDQVMAVRSQEDASYRVFASLRNEASRAAEVSG